MTELRVQQIGDVVLLSVPHVVTIDDDGSAVEYAEVTLERHTALSLASALYHAASGHSGDGLGLALEQILDETP